MYRSPLAFILVCMITVGCAESVPTSPSSAAGANEASAMPPGPPDLAGNWDWSETTNIRLTPPAAAIFGLAPEGPITRLECTSSGELSLTQNGDEFAGSATQSSSCRTGDGVVFDPFPIFPDSWALEGHLAGRSISFTIATGGFPCHYRGSATVSGGIAEALRATGSCEVPKEFGDDKILGWTATRQ